MASRWLHPFRSIVTILVSMLPWAGVTFLLYWLEVSQVWTPDAPYRALASVILLGVSMMLSFQLYHRLRRR